MLSRKLQVKAVLGASAAVHGFQLFFMIKKTCVRKEFRSLRAFFYAGTAFDADAGRPSAVILINRAHRTHLGTESALGAGFGCNRFYFTNVDGIPMTVARLIISGIRVTVNFNRIDRLTERNRFYHLSKDGKCKVFGIF